MAGGEKGHSSGDPALSESAFFLIEGLSLKGLVCKGVSAWGPYIQRRGIGVEPATVAGK